MWVKAIQKAQEFTFPMIISTRQYNGLVSSGLGSFVMLNNEGWFITAAHALAQFMLFNEQQRQIAEKAKISPEVQVSGDWLSNISLWYGKDTHQISVYHVFQDNDIAIGQILNYDPSFCKVYPKFRNPDTFATGMSLCKLGYSFYDIQASFETENNSFRYAQNLFPIPTFPTEGILTRTLQSGKTQDENFNISWIETSSPGFKGQSGGPIFDINGDIAGLQSNTIHLPLGFSPSVEQNGHTVTENQFINLGRGAHAASILAFLDFHKVKYEIAKELI